MKTYMTVITLNNNSYSCGKMWDETSIVTDITIDDIDPDIIVIWASADNQERKVAIIPYHAVEMLIR